jgi:DNA-binding Xre family transcriptional regulator
MKVKTVNNIRKRVEAYQEKTGCSKKWIADQLDITTQWLYVLFEKDNIDAVTLAKIARIVNCEPEKLFKVIVEKD